jgi:predicted XRE-type DNA-binding protein
MSPESSSTPAPRPGAPGRTAEEIRRDIDLQQQELARSVQLLRTRVNELTDWRSQIAEHREQLITGAAVAGFVIGTVMALRRRRRR